MIQNDANMKSSTKIVYRPVPSRTQLAPLEWRCVCVRVYFCQERREMHSLGRHSFHSPLGVFTDSARTMPPSRARTFFFGKTRRRCLVPQKRGMLSWLLIVGRLGCCCCCWPSPHLSSSDAEGIEHARNTRVLHRIEWLAVSHEETDSRAQCSF